MTDHKHRVNDIHKSIPDGPTDFTIDYYFDRLNYMHDLIFHTMNTT